MADLYIYIDGIKGETQRVGGEVKDGSTEISSWSFGVSQSGVAAVTGKGAGAGRASMQDVSFSKIMDKTSPDLFLFCANGKHIPTIELYGRRAGEKQVEYMKIVLTDCMISHVSVAGSDNSGLPMESVSINFVKIEYSYWPQEKDGSRGAVAMKKFDMSTLKA